jgi:CRISPR/Cas system endoribonuclease Cas6 (RAMP superfamily)
MKRVSYKVGTVECERALFIDNNKKFWFHIFFGWRRTFTIDNIEIMDFIFSTRDINIIEHMA